MVSSTQVAPERLKSALNGIDRERVSEIQRGRILKAMVEVVAEHGAANATVAHVVARSRVSRRTFYELFGDCEDCFLAAFDDAVCRTRECVLPAFGTGGRWLERVRAGLVALLGFFDEEPDLARLLVVESFAAGPRALERRKRVLDALTRVVDEGRREAKRGIEPPSLTAEGVVGAVSSVLYSRVSSESPMRLVDLTSPLMSMIALPYLGPGAARREAVRPAPGPARKPDARAPDPLRGLGMRLTYRTVRVLLSIASCPGSSNRKVGELSGLSDQGQISKLLARLQGLGLVENAGEAPGQGGPNAWVLTARGGEVSDALTSQATRS
jgi:AcrR family transcriptional regulator